MLQWLVWMVEKIEGFSDLQIEMINKALPATAKLVSLATDPKTKQLIEEGQRLEKEINDYYNRVKPLIEEAEKELTVISPALSAVIDHIHHKVKLGNSMEDAVHSVTQSFMM